MDHEDSDSLSSHHRSMSFPVVESIFLLSSMQMKPCLLPVDLLGLDCLFAPHGQNHVNQLASLWDVLLIDKNKFAFLFILVQLEIHGFNKLESSWGSHAFMDIENVWICHCYKSKWMFHLLLYLNLPVGSMKHHLVILIPFFPCNQIEDLWYGAVSSMIIPLLVCHDAISCAAGLMWDCLRNLLLLFLG